MELIRQIQMELLEFNHNRDGLVVTTHAFNMVDFILVTRNFEKRLSLKKPIFYYSNTIVEVFYKNPSKKKGKTKKILLTGFCGASWFDFQIQLTRFFTRVCKVIDITISLDYSKLIVVFLPRVYTSKIGKNHHCPLLTVDTKTDESYSENIIFSPSTYNPRIESPKDYDYLF